MQAYDDGKEPYVLTNSTDNKTRDEVKKAKRISKKFKRSKKKKTQPIRWLNSSNQMMIKKHR